MGDDKTRASIMAAGDPTSVKALGRLVKPYDDDAWAAARYEIVVRGNRLKFGQNKQLRAVLLSTGDATLVEAAANDRIWGIGISVKQALAGGRWNGQNLLGKALMEVRAELRRGQLAASDATPPPPPVRRKVSDENREMASASLAARATGDGVRARRAPRVQHMDFEAAPAPAPREAPSPPAARRALTTTSCSTSRRRATRTMRRGSTRSSSSPPCSCVRARSRGSTSSARSCAHASAQSSRPSARG